MNESEALEFVIRMRDEASAVLNKATEAVVSHGEAHAKTTKHAGSFSQMIRLATGSADSFQGALRNVAGSMVAMAAPLAGGILAAQGLHEAYHLVVETLKEMVDATIAQERAQKSLDAAQKITGNASGLNKAEMKEFIEDRSNKYLVDVTTLTQASAKLILLGRTNEESFKGSMDMAIRLSKIMGTDAAGAARILARALADPERGMMMLRRAGVQLTESEKEHIRTTELYNGVAGAQTALLDTLKDKLGSPDAGVAHAGLSGAVDYMSNAWHELMLSFDDSVMSKALTWVINMTAAATHKVPAIFDKNGGWLANLVPGVKDYIDASQQKKAVNAFSALPGQIGDKAAELANARAGFTTKANGDADTALNPSAQSDIVAQLQQELTALKTKYELMGGAARQAGFDGADALKPVEEIMKKLVGDTDDFIKKLGLVNSAAGGGIFTKSEAGLIENATASQDRLDAKIKAIEDLEASAKSDDLGPGGYREAHYQKMLLEKAELEAAVVETNQKELSGNATKKNTHEIELENQKRGQTIIQQERLAELDKADQAAKARAFKPGSVDYQTAVAAQMAAFEAKKGLATANANAATSREVGEQIELAAAYMKSAAAGATLEAQQKAHNNAEDGKGNTNADDIRSAEFGKLLVSNAQAIGKAIDEVVVAEAKATAAANPMEAALQKAFDGPMERYRALMAKTGTGSDGASAAQRDLAAAQLEKDKAASRKIAFYGEIEASNTLLSKDKEAIELDKEKIKYAYASAEQQKLAIEMLTIEREKRKELKMAGDDQKLIDIANSTAEERKKYATAAGAASTEADKANGPFGQWMSSAQSQWKAYETSAVTALDATNAAIVDSIQTGKNFGDTMKSVLNNLTRDFAMFALKAAEADLFKSILGGVTGATGGGGGGMFSKAFSWIGSKFADGGIMTAQGSVPLRKYSGGGIANSPQAAIFGEGSTPEAYVPVPSGRIPVTLSGGSKSNGGNSISTNVTINMAAPPAGGGKGGGSGTAAADQARELGAVITAMVNKNLTEQMRPGGILNPSGTNNGGIMQ